MNNTASAWPEYGRAALLKSQSQAVRPCQAGAFQKFQFTKFKFSNANVQIVQVVRLLHSADTAEH